VFKDGPANVTHSKKHLQKRYAQKIGELKGAEGRILKKDK
jgi:hypothetical protein